MSEQTIRQVGGFIEVSSDTGGYLIPVEIAPAVYASLGIELPEHIVEACEA